MASAKVATITIPLLSARDTGVKFKQSWSVTKSHQQQQAAAIELPKPEPVTNAKDDGNLDDSLTSLNWLQNLRIMRIQNPTPPTSPTPLSIQNCQANKNRGHSHKGGALSILKSENGGIIKLGGGGGGNAHRTSSGGNSHTEIKVTKVSHNNNSHHHSNHNHNNYHLHPHHHHVALQEQKIDYKSNSNMKPPYSYSTLIWMAMKESKKHKMTLSSIYKWIKENFKYYQAADPSWQNSIRHNLSLNKCFQKVARKKDEPGKGGFWRIDPAHADELENGVFKRRRHNSFRELPIKIKTEPESEDESSYMDVISGNIGSKHRDHHHHHHGHSRKQSSPKKRSHSDGHRHKSKRPKISRTQSMKPSSLLDDSIPSSVLKDEFSWNSIFESEIEIDGMRIKTEDILDCDGGQGHDSDNGSDSLEVDTPPPSEHDSVITAADTALDLSINGTSIPRPAWFEEQLKEMDLHPADVQLEDIFAAFDLPPSPAGSLNTGKIHPWAESRDNMNLDASGTFSELFDFGHLTEGVMSWQDNPVTSP